MPTVLLLDVAGSTPGASATYELAEPFDRVLDAVMPLSQPSSALEARQLLTFTTTDGERIYVRPQSIVSVRDCREPR